MLQQKCLSDGWTLVSIIWISRRASHSFCDFWKLTTGYSHTIHSLILLFSKPFYRCLLFTFKRVQTSAQHFECFPRGAVWECALIFPYLNNSFSTLIITTSFSTHPQVWSLGTVFWWGRTCMNEDFVHKLVFTLNIHLKLAYGYKISHGRPHFLKTSSLCW